MRFSERLPTSVEIDGTVYPIRSDFRTSINFELFMQADMEEDELLNGILTTFYEIIPPNPVEGIKQAIWFYHLGKERKENGDKGQQNAYSFDVDWEYIYAAFLEQYNIDLQDVEYLHWWKFKALFLSLREDSKIMEIMKYRTIKPNGKFPKEQREFYRKMKKLYELPKNKHAKEEILDIRERLRNGESIEDVL